MKVRIVCYEDVNGWILGKFALKLREELLLLSIDAEIACTPDPAADINHHIIYIDFDGKRTTRDTVMVTHIDADWKFRKLKQQTEQGAVGICMSSDTMEKLVSAGISKERLCYVNPAHDGIFAPQPLTIGITTRIYPDGRKREFLLTHLARRLDPGDFAFQIMGEGWEDVVEELTRRGFSVQYSALFDRDAYQRMIPALDYYLYLGCDEGSMGFVDALAAGVPTIATPQGFHVDAAGGLVHPFESEDDLYSVFTRIAAQRHLLTDSVARWTWQDYARKHADIWHYLLTGELPQEFLYMDGVASLVDGRNPDCSVTERLSSRLGFVAGSIRALKASLRTRPPGTR